MVIESNTHNKVEESALENILKQQKKFSYILICCGVSRYHEHI